MTAKELLDKRDARLEYRPSPNKTGHTWYWVLFSTTGTIIGQGAASYRAKAAIEARIVAAKQGYKITSVSIATVSSEDSAHTAHTAE